MTDDDHPPPIGDYALIGDGTTAALVGRDGAIDWLCWPRFDSPACFAALLGTPGHGRWRIAPADAHPRIHRRYRDGTLVLETLFATPDGEVALVDFMPPGLGSSSVIRLVQGRRGRIPMRMHLLPRFDYGAVTPWITPLPDGSGLRAIAGPDMAVLRTTLPLDQRDGATTAAFTISAGETATFVLTYAASHLRPPVAVDPAAALTATEVFWSGWSTRCTYHGCYRDAVLRSLVTLKALTHAPTGGIVAAPTTSLPEQPGGSRNWDYRYCWLRDASLTLQALLHAGYTEEARAWIGWLQRSVAGRPDQLRILYGLAGERRVPEWEADWLPGYQGARPVRIGNGAAGQLQLDVFGEVSDTLHLARTSFLGGDPHAWDLQRQLVEHLETVWHLPDEGIWEVRGGRRHFTFSKIMAWVALDRAIASAETFALPAPLDRWRALRTRIHDTVCAEGFDRTLNSFTQSFGTRDLDASLLLIPQLGFLPAGDPRVAGTIAAIERTLLTDGLVRRYDTNTGQDGLPPGEGAFLACSFWLAEAMARQGRMDEARTLFERLLALCNDVGLLAEEYDPATRTQLGNFPQALTHAALIRAALVLGT
ncbi:glycoside hydrolase family 15 protein [Limobrevibacterium gyesilva]|uniref:glycoside hydrolase family 15 protein n=1 Tax=Limobrevibacterium gyesilva TaxID=2991712 RepID=UPI0024C11D19|nr:glycoside hydrolase family 15 protein [Limobrevibacterium gyesilva]